MKKKLIHILFIGMILLVSCTESEETEKSKETHHHTEETVYTCPMHPEIVRNQPGKCPKCGMELVKKNEMGENNLLYLQLQPTNEYVIGQTKTVKAIKKEIPLEITAYGKITYDTRRITTVSARTSGWIEKLFVKYAFQPVTKGQKLMEIYSKELVTEQENYIYLLANDKDNIALVKAAEKRLLLSGLTEQQLSEIKRTGISFKTITIFSPYSGHIHDFSNGQNENMSMDAQQENQKMIAREGMSVLKGQNVFNIYNTEKVWAELKLYQENIGQVKEGMPVQITFPNTNIGEINAKIDFIAPLSGSDNTTVARVFLDNKNHLLKPGMTITAKINAGNKTGIFVLRNSVVHLGKYVMVFVKENNSFRSRVVTTGMVNNDYVEIISGISTEEEIAENAQMLMDSESFIRSTYEK